MDVSFWTERGHVEPPIDQRVGARGQHFSTGSVGLSYGGIAVHLSIPQSPLTLPDQLYDFILI
ncbi:hypothetical protein D9M68_957230 [compost metagenome]